MKNKIKKLIPISAGFSPLLAMAASTIEDLIYKIGGIFNAIIPGVLQFVTSGGDEEKRKEGRDHIIYGLIGLFIMVAVWGLVNAIAGTFGFTTTKDIPTKIGEF
ncbi:MAG: hypothetical protein HYW71_01335 [Candidatus Niyogibacteria bacterium]|nr:hypothetical protein [Candidatus Niyogibacteria bacterium]